VSCSDLGCHVDGYLGVVAGSTVVGSTAEAPVTGKAADVLAAAYTGAEAILRLVKPGAKNTDIPDVLEKIAAAHGCSVVEGVLSHQMKRFLIDGEKCILAKADVENKVEEAEFEVNEVYHLDVAMSTGDGKTRELDEKQRTVFKRASDVDYQLKMKASRMVLNEIKEKFPSLPFTLRQFEDTRARLGMTELTKHEMVYPYPVLFEKEGALVAHEKYTILLMPTGTMQITGVGSCPLATECEVKDEEILALLAQSIGKKKKKKKKKKAAVDESVEVEK
jgi:curved DNA binding protein